MNVTVLHPISATKNASTQKAAMFVIVRRDSECPTGFV